MYKAKEEKRVCINVSRYEFYWDGFIHLPSSALEISLFNVLRFLVRN